MRFLKNFIAKIFGIKQCQCPPQEEPKKNSWGINDLKKPDIIGHCSKHDSYKFSCLDCNFAIRKKS
jgi:hypothetical protein